MTIRDLADTDKAKRTNISERELGNQQNAAKPKERQNSKQR